MKWITENIQVILAVAGAIAFWLNSRREAAEKAAQEKEAALRRASQPASMAKTDVAADDELTKARNTAAFAEVDLVPDVLAGVAEIDTGCTIMGRTSALPLMPSSTIRRPAASPTHT